MSNNLLKRFKLFTDALSTGGGGIGAAWGAITGTISDQTDLQNALDAKVDENPAITSATKTKIRRPQPIGVVSIPVSAVVGQQGTSIQFDFEAPIIVNPGEFVGVFGKILSGAATASQVLQFVISPNLYHE